MVGAHDVGQDVGVGLVLAQSTPAVGRGGSATSVTLTVVSSLLKQWKDTR